MILDFTASIISQASAYWVSKSTIFRDVWLKSFNQQIL